MTQTRFQDFTRRAFLLSGAAAATLSACTNNRAGAGADTGATGPSTYADSEWREITETEWQERLSPEAFRVLRRDGTERAFTSPLNEEKREGTYHCAGCDLPLFRSETKFDSGTGWPSFYTVIDGAVGTSEDRKLIYVRTEYHCARCLGHQGHVFDDGPQPTGLRYCNNGVALTFKPA